jgi:predicted phosphodiesterase
MYFTLISDIHIDINPWDWSLLQHCDVTAPMVVAGDISNDVWATCAWIKQLRDRFHKVIWVMGNHDAYNLGFHKTRLVVPGWHMPRSVSEIYDHYARWSDTHDIHFLNRSKVVIDHVEFLGITGWHTFDAWPQIQEEYQVTAWQDHMMDARHIRWGSDPDGAWMQVKQAACADAAWLQHEITLNHSPKVIISHHVPHARFLKWTADPVWNMLNGSFLNSQLTSCVTPDVKVWCYGHTHFRNDALVSDVRYVNNARGYPHENGSWQPVEIEVN